MNKQNGIFGKTYSSPEINLSTMTADIMTTSDGTEQMAAVEWDAAQWDGQGGSN